MEKSFPLPKINGYNSKNDSSKTKLKTQNVAQDFNSTIINLSSDLFCTNEIPSINNDGIKSIEGKEQSILENENIFFINHKETQKTMNMSKKDRLQLQKIQSSINYSIHQNSMLDQQMAISMLRLINKYDIQFNIAQPKMSNIDSTIKAEEDKKLKSRIKFSINEDSMLKNIVGIFGPKNWRLIASMIPNKTARQCRDRYMNYLAPGYVHSNWTKEEDLLLAEKFEEYGPKWSQIRLFFPSRTANAIKNRFNYTVSRMDHFVEKSKNQDIKSDNIIEWNDESKEFGIDESYNFNINQENLNDIENYQNCHEFHHDNFDDNEFNIFS